MRQSKIGRKYGCRPDHPDIHHPVYRPKIAKMEMQIPPSVNLVDKLPACWDQGQEGSCTGHGTGAAVAYLHPEFMPSRNEIYFNGRRIEGDTDQDNGAQIADVVSGLAEWGVAAETLWPYNEQDMLQQPPDSVYQASLQYKISDYARIADLDDTKQCLAEGYPVIIGFSVYEYFESPEMNETGILKMPGWFEEMLGGHCVLVIGYDESTAQLFIRNSWGPSWGPFNGNLYMPYSYFTSGLVSDSWVIKA